MVRPLILLLLLCTGQSYTESLDQKIICPPGSYYSKNKKCEPCQPGRTFAAIENSILGCLRCTICPNDQVTIRHCTITRNTECGCKKGFYPKDAAGIKDCVPCNYTDYNNDDYQRRCNPCQRKNCQNQPQCKKKCSSTPTPSAIQTTSTAPQTSAENPQSSELIKNNSHVSWLLSGVISLIVLVMLISFGYQQKKKSNLCCVGEKDEEIQEEDSNDSQSHQGCSPTALTFIISEKTPMTLSHSPARPQDAAHVFPSPPKHKALSLDESSPQWPAIVLYEIIKEVPLRRWKEFLRLLSVRDQELDRVELEAGSGVSFTEKQYLVLRLWSQRSTASLNDVFSVLHYMDLTSCAEQLKDNLARLEWWPGVQ